MPPEPYKSTAIFDNASLPAAIRNDHRTKPGVWGLLRVLEGEVDLVFNDPPQRIIVTPGHPAPIAPQATHHVETSGPMRLQVDFYTVHPLTGDAAG